MGPGQSRKNPADPYCYGSTGPEQRRGHINEADASAGRRGLRLYCITTDSIQGYLMQPCCQEPSMNHSNFLFMVILRLFQRTIWARQNRCGPGTVTCGNW